MMQADVFCRVIDNYGDIGVAWRLVRQLQAEHDWKIRLWVDDLPSFQRIEPRVTHAAQQHINDIEIIDWSRATDFTPAPVVIATFSCDLPEVYLANLSTGTSMIASMHDLASTDTRTETRTETSTETSAFECGSILINLEYLSAETWVEGCHGLAALRADGLSAYFFFPGFTKKTGGLLRESDLITRRDAWQNNLSVQRTFLESLLLSSAALTALFPENQHHAPITAARLMTLFCYAHAPVASLIEVLAQDTRQTVLLIPEGIHPSYQTGRIGQLLIERIPFLPQTEYDKLLWTADLNFVRGEDSIVRAIWAGKPFVWQIYPQTEHTHLVKLRAWLDVAELPLAIKELFLSWNAESGEGLRSAFPTLLTDVLHQDAYTNWRNAAAQFCNDQTMCNDLALALTKFCLSKRAN